MDENTTKELFNYDENDEIADEVYFSDKSDVIEKAMEKQKTNSERLDEEEREMMSEEGLGLGLDDQEEDVPEEDSYKVTSISEAFLRGECAIKNESSKTEIKFEYRGQQYKGICIQKMPKGRWDYVFLVRPIVRGRKAAEAEKTLKKICVNEAVLL